ncbi:MAG: HAMP domain-containing sensor histidine kinase [Polyangiaceae bacterium]
MVSGRARMISSGRLAPENVTESATIIDEQAARMTKIIRGLLDFARRGAAKKGRIDLRALTMRTLEILAPLTKKRGITLRVEGAESARLLDADSGQIEQVLTNLVVNAVDATPDGGSVVVTLVVADATPPDRNGTTPGPYLRLDVRDDGAGIAKEDLEQVFEPFFTTKEVGQGTGLGLSVAHGIVHDHGGWIDVSSEPQRGSCFSVYLPSPHSLRR